MTQLSEAKEGNITDEMMYVANQECIDPKEMMKGISEGRELFSGKKLTLDNELTLEPLIPMVIELR